MLHFALGTVLGTWDKVQGLGEDSFGGLGDSYRGLLHRFGEGGGSDRDMGRQLQWLGRQTKEFVGSYERVWEDCHSGNYYEKKSLKYAAFPFSILLLSVILIYPSVEMIKYTILIY